VLGSENEKLTRIARKEKRRQERAVDVKAGMLQRQDPRSELSECRECRE
jgi:hypothetical protein